MKSLSRSRLGKGQSWDSNPGLSSSPGLTLETVLATVTVLHQGVERKQIQRGEEAPEVTRLVRDLQSQSPAVSHLRLILPVPVRTIIHPFILSSSQLLWSTWGGPGTVVTEIFLL